MSPNCVVPKPDECMYLPWNYTEVIKKITTTYAAGCSRSGLLFHCSSLCSWQGERHPGLPAQSDVPGPAPVPTRLHGACCAGSCSYASCVLDWWLILGHCAGLRHRRLRESALLPACCCILSHRPDPDGLHPCRTCARPIRACPGHRSALTSTAERAATTARRSARSAGP